MSKTTEDSVDVSDNVLPETTDKEIKVLDGIPEGELANGVFMNIEKGYSKKQADKFKNNILLNDIESYDNNYQRGVISRVLVNKLLAHRSKHDDIVTDAIYCLIPDGTNSTWMNVLKVVIIPFLKENKVEL